MQWPNHPILNAFQKEKDIDVDVESWADERLTPGRTSIVGTLELRRIASIEPARLVRVWLPAGYQKSTQSYPVLYMLDGQNVFDRATSAIGEEWGVDETLAQLIESNTIKPMIVVAIDNSSKRVDEYTSISDGESNRKRGGNAEPFAKWIAEKLKPQIDREYRTQANRDSTWIGGSSLGGKEGTTENAARGNVERFERLQKTFTTIVQKQNSNLIVGGRLFPEAKHNESAWRERFAEAIQFIAK